MEDRLLVEALRSRDPIAMGAVYDDYAERLYAYCWFQLRNGDAAQVALRDTLMCAEAHIGRLRAPARFGPWLYALARIECRRRRPASPVQPDIPVARHDQDDVDLRLMAWRAVGALPPLSQELLDLRYHHDLPPGDIALVVGLPAREVGELLGQARVLLEAALIAEILCHEDLYACAGRAALLRPRTDAIDDDLREALVRHSLDCPQCARHLPDTIAPAKVYDLLPCAVPSQQLRPQIMNCFTDPELAGYRLFAAARVSRFGAHGFPQQPGAGRTAAFRRASRRASRRAAVGWSRALGAAAGAVLAAVSATTVCRWLGQESARDSHGIVAARPGAHSPRPSPAPPGHPGAGRPVSATFPLREPGSVRPAVVLGTPSSPPDFLRATGAGRLAVTPARLTLAPGGTGTITVSATYGAVHWTSSATGPVHLSPPDGALEQGVAQIVTVQAPSRGPGTAAVTFWPGGHLVQVAWGGPPPSSPPPPTSPPPPPDTPTPTPTPSPTPAPTEPATRPSSPSESSP